MNTSSCTLQLICPDRPGLVKELVSWVTDHKGNILHADHHTDNEAGLFLSRIEWGLDGFAVDNESIPIEVKQLARHLDGKASVHFSDAIPRAAIFISKQSHCLLDLLWRARSGEIRMDIPLVISNHQDLEGICNDLDVNYYYIPNNLKYKSDSESRMLDILLNHQIELVILAKYMQVLTGNFIERCPPIINIHHSFLPAFKGANPYFQAWQRGVKLIGATAHYVTEELDDGPIIEQTLVNVSHRDEVSDLIRKGRDTERVALATAVRLHLRHQVMVYRGRTAVFA
ncbi:formyltetrahydrofolate deformylase [Prochlorococcus sp. MIT 1341]|uniref:formyltetrahydrofolate deformylase n=1 Tax=Prochlorococcus sp. MIT 1341 TaxID=3096221 RepID=UPI002A7626F0|nr:formyltetrahydrofolate deformylase [Prochlorococcus sp. MIT 1341]